MKIRVTVRIDDVRALRALTFDAVRAYVIQRGWRRDYAVVNESGILIEAYLAPPGKEPRTIVLRVGDERALDKHRRMSDILEALSAVEGVHELRLYRALMSLQRSLQRNPA